LKLSIYEIDLRLFAKSKCRIQIIEHTCSETCAFGKIKVSDIEGKMVLTPWSSTTTPF